MQRPQAIGLAPRLLPRGLGLANAGRQRLARLAKQDLPEGHPLPHRDEHLRHLVLGACPDDALANAGDIAREAAPHLEGAAFGHGNRDRQSGRFANGVNGRCGLGRGLGFAQSLGNEQAEGEEEDDGDPEAGALQNRAGHGDVEFLLRPAV